MIDLKNKQTLGGGGGKALLAFFLLIFIFIPFIIEARTVHRKMYMVCRESQKAFWNADLGRGECCDADPEQDEHGNYFCPDYECSKNEDCPENSICVLPMRQCLSCVEGYTAYCAKIGKVTIDDATWTGCTEAACMAGTCEQVWYEQDPTMGYCCTGDAAAYCSVETETGECSRLACCEGSSYRSSNSLYRYCCASDKSVTPLDNVQACCADNQMPYCYSYDADGHCTSASCCSASSGSLEDIQIGYYEYDENGMGKRGFCCAGTIYRSSYSSLGESCCASPKVASEPFEGGMQACCSADQTAYCSGYNENGVCTGVGCCSGTPYCYSSDADGECEGYRCCSGEVDIFGGEGYCCSTGTPYCGWYDDEWKKCTDKTCCNGTVYQHSSREYYFQQHGDAYNASCCSSSDVLSQEFDGLHACCSSGLVGYCNLNDENGKCLRTNCCSGTPYRYSPTEQRCCTSGVVSGDFDGIQGCCGKGAYSTPYCKNYDENGKCIRVDCGPTMCTAYQKTATEWDCCSPSKNLIPWGDYFICTEISESSCSSEQTPYQETPSTQSCCSNDDILTEKFDGLQECCGRYGYDGSATFGYCSRKDDTGTCLDVFCCQGQVYQTGENNWSCCPPSQQVSGNFDGLQGCCPSGQTPYCSERSSAGKCENVWCCDGNVYHNSDYSGDHCCPTKYSVYQSSPTSQSCCMYSVMGNFDGIQACCEEDRTAYCSSYDENGKCQSTSCCYNGDVYCQYRYSDGSCKQGNCCAGGTLYQSVTGYQECCAGTQSGSNHVLDIEDGLQICCSSAYSGYCSRRDENGKCIASACCSGTVYQAAPNVERCCAYVVSGDFDGLQGCCSSGQTPYCSQKDSSGKCTAVSCCRSSYTVSEDFDGLQACCSSGYTAYCSSYDENGVCQSVYCCSGERYCSAYDTFGRCKSVGCCSSGQTPYRDTQTSMRCCSSSYQVSGDFDGLQACHPPGYTPYCRTYDADGKCTSTSACRSGYVPYRSSSTGTASCCRSTLVRDVGDGIGVCLSSDSYVPFCSSYDSNGTCLSGSYCSSGQMPYRSSQTNASCCSNSLTESIGGIQACVQPGYTRAYCSGYLNGRCDKVSVSYIAGGCIPYRISATKGGCCTGTVVKNGDYETCI